MVRRGVVKEMCVFVGAESASLPVISMFILPTSCMWWMYMMQSINDLHCLRLTHLPISGVAELS